MKFDVIFKHVNLVAGDVEALIRFYMEVFGCIPVPPPRALSGEWLERGTGVAGADLRGMHLRLPGGGDEGPTLEVFEYRECLPALPPAANRPGFGHIAFGVEDVDTALEAVVEAGGSAAGEVVSAHIEGVGEICFVYAKDPEGNLIELQKIVPS